MKSSRSRYFIYHIALYLALVGIVAESYRLRHKSLISGSLTPNNIEISSDIKNNTLSLLNANKANNELSKEGTLLHSLGDVTEKEIKQSTTLPPTIVVTENVPVVISTTIPSDDIEATTSDNFLETSSEHQGISLTSNQNLVKTNWNLVWMDDFDGEAGSLPRSENWIFDIGYSYPGGPAHWGNREAQYYTADPENVCVDGKGNLKITPLRDATGNWTSARIETTRTNFKPPPGGKMAIEGRIHMPDVTGDSALGYWPAFWALGAPLRGHYHNWPKIGEFDIMENVNGLDSVWGVLHCGRSPGGPCRETNGLGNRRPCPGASCQSDFHIYRFEWDDSKDPKELSWYVDGEKYNNVTSDSMDEESWNNMTNHSGYFILLNVAMGGSFPNALANFQKTPTNLTEPGHSMLVDYVAVYDSID